MQELDANVLLQSLDGTWETCGSDRARGVWPEKLKCGVNSWGPDKASFELHRDPAAIWPDIGAFTPVEIEVGGVGVWSGRVQETPTRASERAINVQCEGWQYHLDDDAYERVYVHTKLGDYEDIRTKPTAVLGINGFNAAGQVSLDRGAIQLGWANGTPLAAGACVGVVLDFGVYSTAKRVALEWDSSNNTNAFTLYCRGCGGPSNAEWTAGNFEDAFTIVNNSGTSGTTAGTFVTARRYIQMFLYNPAFAGTTGLDHWFRLKAIRVFSDTAFESGNQSTLKADTVIKDARDRATTFISRSNLSIAAQTFSIPEFAITSEPRTPREVINAVNAYEDCQASVGVDRVLRYRDKPTAPIYEVGAWSGSDFEDASANSGEEIYNHAIVVGETPDGFPLRVERMSVGRYFMPVSGISLPNPSFEADVTSWTPIGSGTISRVTGGFPGVPHSAPGTGSWSDGSGNLAQFDGLSTPVTGRTWYKGIQYHAQIYLMRRTTGTNPNIKLQLGAATDYAISESYDISGSWVLCDINWTPAVTTTGPVTFSLLVVSLATVKGLFVDTASVGAAVDTLPGRRGFMRTKILPVKSAMTQAAGEQIADTFLAGHRTTPFKGRLSVTGQGGVRRILGGEGLHPSQLLLGYGELIRFSDRLDPDTGALGRDGRLASVEYDHETQQVTADIDNRRDNFEALLERLAVVSGNAFGAS